MKSLVVTHLGQMDILIQLESLELFCVFVTEFGKGEFKKYVLGIKTNSAGFDTSRVRRSADWATWRPKVTVVSYNTV